MVWDWQVAMADLFFRNTPRSVRLREARRKGSHTKDQWLLLKTEFDLKCVRCLTNECNVEKDHIIPLYQGGSDSIENIQPLCAYCNSSKGPETFNWKVYRRAFHALG